MAEAAPRTYASMLPHCDACGNHLMPESRAICRTCGQFVCLRSRDCHLEHSSRHETPPANVSGKLAEANRIILEAAEGVGL